MIFLFRWIFRDPKVDLRFLAAGVVLPDVIDLTVATAAGASSAELIGHSLISPTVVTVAVLLATRRGRKRRAWMALVVAWLLHLVVDLMWLQPEILFWPFFGWDVIPTDVTSFWPAAWGRAVADPWRWVLEVVGLAYLTRLALASGLSHRQGRRELISTGRLPERPVGG